MPPHGRVGMLTTRKAVCSPNKWEVVKFLRPKDPVACEGLGTHDKQDKGGEFFLVNDICWRALRLLTSTLWKFRVQFGAVVYELLSLSCTGKAIYAVFLHPRVAITIGNCCEWNNKLIGLINSLVSIEGTIDCPQYTTVQTWPLILK